MSHPNPAAAPQRTPLFESHLACHGKMVDFAGWEMPINYGSQIDEHHAVRNDAGMFDVSHMCALDLTGADAALATPPAGQRCGQADHARQSTLFLHVERRSWCDRRSDCVLLFG